MEQKSKLFAVGDWVKINPNSTFEYEVAEIRRLPHGLMVGIYDEPPSKHVDFWNESSLTLSRKAGINMEQTTELKPHQKRVVDEKTELDDKLSKLKSFIDGNAIFAGLPDDEKKRLVRQHSCMTEYSSILGERIAAFTA